MKPSLLKKPSRQTTTPAAMLEDVEIAAILPTPNVVASPEFLAELCSAASMIMDRQECEALVREIRLAQRTHPVAA